MKYIIANWKANKNLQEVMEWKASFETLLKANQQLISKLTQNTVTIIIAPPTPFIPVINSFETIAPNIRIASQTLSAFEAGAYTGEVTAQSLEGLVVHSILGHSERRSHFGEGNTDLATRVALAQKYGIEPIFCVRNSEDTIPSSVKLVAFEPVEAIGTGMNMPAAQVSEKKKTFILPAGAAFIYGGSVKPETAAEYLQSPDIDGLLIGGASLQVESFLAIAALA